MKEDLGKKRKIKEDFRKKERNEYLGENEKKKKEGKKRRKGRRRRKEEINKKRRI
jgi:hypothetical protein